MPINIQTNGGNANSNTGRRTMTISEFNQANPGKEWGENTKAVIKTASGKTYTLDKKAYDWVTSRYKIGRAHV